VTGATLQPRLGGLWAALGLGAPWALWHLPELISDPTLQRCRCNSLWIRAQFVIQAWLYNTTNAILPIMIICHAVTNTADRFVPPEFPNKELSGGVVVHGWALRPCRSHRDACHTPETPTTCSCQPR
jgi:membrane protease YdiL (CAAX protease family)